MLVVCSVLFLRPALHHPGQAPHVTPPLPSGIKRLRRAIFLERVAPPQAIAIDEDYAAQNPPPPLVCKQTPAGQWIIDARRLMAFRNERSSLLVRRSGALNHAAAAASSKSNGPDLNRKRCLFYLAKVQTKLTKGSKCQINSMSYFFIVRTVDNQRHL